jgi:hypothetical protein
MNETLRALQSSLDPASDAAGAIHQLTVILTMKIRCVPVFNNSVRPNF